MNNKENRNYKKLLALLCVMAVLVSLIGIKTEKASADNGDTVSFVVGATISYGALFTNVFGGTVNGNYGEVYCMNPSKYSPKAGTYAISYLDNSSLLAKAMYYLYGGAGFTYGLLISGTDDDMRVATHMAVSYILDPNGDWKHGVAGPILDGIMGIAESIDSNLPAAPEHFRAYVFNMNAGTQAMVGSYLIENGSITLNKTSANTFMTEGNANYSLADAVYGVYSDEGCSSKVGELRTNAEGATDNLEVTAGTYYIKELSAPKGYALDSKIHSALVTSGQTTILDVSDAPQNNPIQIMVDKIDLDTKVNKSQGNASLEGAEFTIKYYAIEANTHEDGIDPASQGVSATRTWVYKTDADGYIDISINENKVSGDELFYNNNGIGTIPLGVVTIQETKAPEGYLLDDNRVHIRKIVSKGSAESVETYNQVTIEEQIIRGGIEVAKWDIELDENTPQGNASLEGTEIEIVNISNNPVLVDGKEYAYNEVVKTIITDSIGVAITAYDALPYGQYEVREKTPPNGYTEDGIVSRVFTIQEDGVIIKLTDKETALKNSVIRGGVELEKWDNEIDRNEAQGNATLTGAVMEIINKSEHAVLVGAQLYEPNTVVTSLTTDERGAARLEPDSLPYGTYEVKEVIAPEGYLGEGVLSRTFDIVDEGVIVQLSDTNTAIKNNPIRGDLELIKIEDGTGHRMAGVLFELVSETTGESHTFVTDKNGYYSTESKWNPHTENTNAGETDKDGVWFGESHTINNNVGALLYDTYIINELPCAANEGKILLTGIKITIERNKVTVNMGTLTNDEEPMPNIGTCFLENNTEKKEIVSNGVHDFVDIIEYSNFDISGEYKAYLTVMDYETKEALVINEEVVSSELLFTVDEPSGEIRIPISIDTTGLGNKRLVAFEEVYKIIDGKEVPYSKHKDIEDLNQTIEIVTPNIKTQFFESETEKKEVVEGGRYDFVDVVEYNNFEINEKYKAVLVVMDYETGEPLLIDEELVKSSFEFTVEKPSGEIKVPIHFDTTDMGEKTLVAYETVYKIVDDKELIYATHYDLESTDQTIHIEPHTIESHFPEPEIKPNIVNKESERTESNKRGAIKTGDKAGTSVIIILLITSGIVIAYVIKRKRKFYK
ncbi:MAG: SpaA isopeptide-forming pilin-related protein [Suipraeoptans sp.]